MGTGRMASLNCVAGTEASLIASTGIMPPAMASSAGVIPKEVFLMTSWAMGDNWEISPSPAETLRKSMPQSIHHWGVLTASPNWKESAAETLEAAGLKPAGSQPFGGFL